MDHHQCKHCDQHIPGHCVPPNRKSPWQKRLYVRQPYPDNFVPSSFMKTLTTNENVKPFRFRRLVVMSSRVIQQLSLVVLFVSVFVALLTRKLDPLFLLGIEIVATLFGYAIVALHKPETKHPLVIFRFILICGVLIAVSPILHTLTITVASDSIWNLTSFFFILHLIFTDYNRLSTPFSSPIAINASIFAAVLLASRLASPMRSISLLFLAFGLFGLFPSLREFYQQQAWVTLAFFLIAAVSAFCIAMKAFLCFIGVCGVISFVCPFWLRHIQHYKCEISGPWDEALPVFRGPSLFKR